MMKAFFINRMGSGFVVFVVCFLPCLPFLPFHQMFSLDWLNHLWTIEYFGQHIKSHLVPPLVFNANPVMGIPVPIFYSYYFYSAVGFLGILIGSANALTGTIFCLFAIQFILVRRSIRILSGDIFLANIIATLVTWAIYPLSNIYHRGAIPEFVAVTLITSSVALLAVFLRKGFNGEPIEKFDGIAPGFFLAMACCTHPLTAIYGGSGLFVLLLGIAIFTRADFLLKAMFANAIAILVTLSGWLMVILTVAKDFEFVKSNPLTVIPGIDSFIHRISPVAFEWRSVLFGIAEEITFPYIDTQINMPLLLVALGAGVLIALTDKTRLVRSPRVLFGWGLFVLAVLTILISSFQAIATQFNFLLRNLQFAYRLVSYVNLLLLAVVLVFVPILRKNEAFSRILFVSLTISMCGLFSKLIHVYAVRAPSSSETVVEFMKKYRAPKEKALPFWDPSDTQNGKYANNLTPSYYGHPEYSIEKSFLGTLPRGELPIKWVELQAQAGAEFGNVEAQTIELNEKSLVITNIEAFPWNRISVDGEPIGPDITLTKKSMKEVPEIGGIKSTVGLGVILPEGKYQIDYLFQPNPIWLRLIYFSWIFIFAWVILFIWSLVSSKQKPSGMF